MRREEHHCDDKRAALRSIRGTKTNSGGEMRSTFLLVCLAAMAGAAFETARYAWPPGETRVRRHPPRTVRCNQRVADERDRDTHFHDSNGQFRIAISLQQP